MAEGDRPNGPDTGGPQPPGIEQGADEGLIQTFLIADVRGYTSFSQEHGDEAAGRLAGRFADVTTQVVEAGGGAVLELRGDEALCIFSTTRRAIRAAVDLQDRFLAETQSDPTLPLPVGIGIDTGEAVPVAGGFRGRALNLAARLCGSARAGEILATREAIHMSGRMDGIRIEDRGVSSFKGIPEPVGVIRVTGEGEDPARWFADHAPSHPTSRRSTRRRLGIAALAALLVAAVAIPLIVTRGSGSTTIAPDSVGVLDPRTGDVKTTIGFATRPGDIVAMGGDVWIANPDAGTVARIDPAKEAVVDTVPVGEDPTALAAGAGAVWAVNSADPSLSRISPGTNTVVDTIPVGNGPGAVVVGGGSVWVTNRFDGTVSRVDPIRGEVVKRIPVGLEPVGLAFGFGSVWVGLAGSNSVVRIDPETNSVGPPIGVGSSPGSLAVSEADVWVVNTLDDTVMRIDPERNLVADTVEVGDGPSRIAIVGTTVWVSNEADGTLSQIEVGRVPARETSTGSVPVGLADVGGDLWVTVRGTATSHRGGTLRMLSADQQIPSLDSRVAYDVLPWMFLHVIGDGLLGFKAVGGDDGNRLVPDLATDIPAPADGGRTYSFALRPGIRYSSGEVVAPADFRRAIEQGFLLNRDAHANLFGGIVGGEACRTEPRTCDLSRGIVTDDVSRTITFRLVAPDADFLYKLALPFAYPAPASAVSEEQVSAGIPGTGPYMLETPETSEGLTLVRNPNFHVWSSEAQPAGNVDRIELSLGIDPEAQVDAVTAGDADVAFGAASTGRLDQLLVRYPAQIHISPYPMTSFIDLNSALPPFNDVRARRALNYAVDRRQVVRILGGDAHVSVTCQQLPPNFPSYAPYCPYTRDPGPRGSGLWSGADVEKARDLVRRSDTTGMQVTVEHTAGFQELAHYVVGVLDGLGYDARERTIADEDLHTADASYQMKLPDLWYADYPAASNFLANRFTCRSSNLPPSGFCDPRIDRMIDRALEVQTDDPIAAAPLWTAIDRAVVDQAPYLWLVNGLNVDFISERTGNYQFSPQWMMLFSQAWVR